MIPDYSIILVVCFFGIPKITARTIVIVICLTYHPTVFNNAQSNCTTNMIKYIYIITRQTVIQMGLLFFIHRKKKKKKGRYKLGETLPILIFFFLYFQRKLYDKYPPWKLVMKTMPCLYRQQKKKKSFGSSCKHK